MTSGFFITGTDTDVGKTVVATVLTLALGGTYWKPIQSGASDLEQVKLWSQLGEEHFFSSIYSFKNPLSLDQAAALEGIKIELDALRFPSTTENKTVLVEGAGGVYAPLNDQHCMLDLMRQLALPIIIVTRGTLGTINHTLLTIKTLRAWNFPIHGIVFSGELVPENQKAIEHWGEVQTLFHVPKIKLSGESLQLWVAQHQKIIQNAMR